MVAWVYGGRGVGRGDTDNRAYPEFHIQYVLLFVNAATHHNSDFPMFVSPPYSITPSPTPL